MIKRVCVYCASSSKVDSIYKKEAFLLGSILSKEGIACNYGGGSVGLMGELADAMCKNSGEITGIIPKFMVEKGWGNPNIKQIEVDTMHERKQRMIKDVDAAIALPGGCGTLEELMEIITWKQLSIFNKPIIILNVNHYFDPLIEMLEKAISENFMREEHKKMWVCVSSAEEVIKNIKNAPHWDDEAINFAAI